MSKASETDKSEVNSFLEGSSEADLDVENARRIRPPAPGSIDAADFPDGGLEAWMVVLGGWCCMFTSIGWINCIGVFQDYYQAHQLSTYTPSTVAWIVSTKTFMVFVGAPICGKIFDSYGARLLLLTGTFFHILGLMMTSLSSEYYQFFLAQAICSGLGACAIFYTSMNAVGTWFSKNRALALGVISSGSSVGGVVTTYVLLFEHIMIQQLIPKIGFAWAMRSVAFMFLGLQVLAIFTVKSRLKHRPTPFRVMDFLVPLRELPFLLVACGSFFFFWGVFLPPNFIILQARFNGMSARLLQYLLPTLNAASIFGRILPGWASDHIGRFNVMILTTCLSVVVVLALWIPAHTNAPTIVFAVLYGFTSGAFVAMIPATVAQISDVRQIGVRFGTNFFIMSLAVLTGNPLGGFLISRNDGGFTYFQIFCGVTMFIGASFFVAARAAQCGMKWKKI